MSLLPQASQQEGVHRIRTIIPPQPAQGVVVSEGAAAHGAPAWHAAGVRGQGIKIGIIDVGFEGFSALMGTELPATVEARCYTEVGVFTSNISDCTDSEDRESTRKHGTAVTEAIFDIAPEAEYYVANNTSWGDLRNAVLWMMSNNVDVINMSLAMVWYGPGDGTSPSSDRPLGTVDTAVAGGITWVNAAGNGARDTWFGAFSDTDSDRWHNLSEEDECNNFYIPELDEDESFLAQLRWDDKWGGAARDLNLILYDVTALNANLPARVASSAFFQVGLSDHIPLELLSYKPPSAGEYCLAIQHTNGTTPSWIQLQAWRSNDLEYHTIKGSIGNPAESANPGMLAVGAAPWSDTSTIERFSSQGPTPDGRIKPDIVGADGGQSVTYRSDDRPDGNWLGTSQASPHVAGLAALVKQRFPHFKPQQVALYIKEHAEARGAVPNNTWGYGFARLPASDAPAATATATAIPTPVAGCTEAITPPTTINGTWASDCLSEKPSPATGGGQRYARFYTFTMTQASDVEITMESSQDTYLYLLAGHGTDGATVDDNDDYDSNEFSLAANTDSGISATLDAGDYTIEATTYESETTGDFTLTVTVGGATAPSPSPSPSPTPPDYDIEEHACDADDLTNIGTFTLDSEFGPETYAANYDGVRAYYRATWDAAQTGLRVVCMAYQYDGVQNARWDGLNYSSVLQGFGAIANLEVLAHGQAFVSPRVGDDMLALHAEYQFDNDLTRLSEVRFIEAATNTVSLVRFIVSNGSGYPDIDDVAGVARLIADRVPRDNSQSQGAQRAGLLSEAFALPRLR